MKTLFRRSAGHAKKQNSPIQEAAMAASRFILVDDHTLFREALRNALEATFPNVDLEGAGSFDELEKKLIEVKETELILLDLKIPGVQGFSGLLHLRTLHPDLPVIVVSATDDPVTIRRCIDYGASGFVSKSASVDVTRDAIRQVLAGNVYTPPDFDPNAVADPADRELAVRLSTLTPQQIRVLAMLGEGLLNKQIAYKLNVSEATIKAHVSAILTKLNVDSRTQAVIAINKGGLNTWTAPV
jgi:DNA-binding NarL/FixJ family response regulator